MEWIKVDLNKLPDKECLAIGYQNEMLIGYIREDSEVGIACEDDFQLLTDVTHYCYPKPPERPNK